MGSMGFCLKAVLDTILSNFILKKKKKKLQEDTEKWKLIQPWKPKLRLKLCQKLQEHSTNPKTYEAELRTI